MKEKNKLVRKRELQNRRNIAEAEEKVARMKTEVKSGMVKKKKKLAMRNKIEIDEEEK